MGRTLNPGHHSSRPYSGTIPDNWGCPCPNTCSPVGCQWIGLFVKELDLAPPTLTWTDITCDVQSIGLRYGRERFTNRYDVSTMQIDMVNNEGKYSFHNPHPLGLAPGRQIRVTATYKGVTYPLGFHVLDSMTDGCSHSWACHC